jgi:hypothetical protein
MFKRLYNILFPRQFKIGNVVTCELEICKSKECIVDRVYTRGNDKVPFVRVKFTDELGRLVSVNVKAEICQLVRE